MNGGFCCPRRLRSYEAFFLQGADGLGADLELHLLAVNNNGLGLEVWLPDFLGVALAKADIAAVLFAFTGEFAYLHRFNP